MGSIWTDTSYGVTDNGTLYKREAGWFGTGAGEYTYYGDPNAKSPRPPDLTDEYIRRSRQAELARQRAGQGRRATFLTGPAGASSPAPTKARTLLGGLR